MEKNYSDFELYRLLNDNQKNYYIIGSNVGPYTTESFLQKINSEIFEKAKYVAALNGMNGKKEIWLKESMLPMIDIEFEDGRFPCYKNYDIYLSNLFGDYMKLPPVEKRIPHNDKGYWVNKK